MRGGRAAGRAALGIACLLAACGRAPGPPGNPRLQLPRTLPAGTLPWVGRVAIDWQRGERPREHILIGPGGVELGPSEGPLARYLFRGRERFDDLRGFVRSFAPFTIRGKGEELAFHGAGATAASPAERRMIATWAHRVVAEAVAGPGGSAYGSLLSWHRSADAGGECDEVRVDLTGEVRAGPCGLSGGPSGGQDGLPAAAWHGRLADDRLRRLYLWADAWAPFQSGPEEEPPATPVRLIFAGRGKTVPSAAERAAVAAFAADLYRELAAQHPVPAASPVTPAAPGAAVKPMDKTAGKASPPATPAPAPEPAGPRALRPETPTGSAATPLVVPAAPPPKPASPPAAAPPEPPTDAPPPPDLRR